MSEVRPMSYIGVSGVVNPQQQADLLAMAMEFRMIDEGYLLALGVKAVHKTQWEDRPNKYGREWYPVGEAEFAGALEPSEYSLHVAQLFLELSELHDADYRANFVARILARGASWLDAVQFDLLPWHEQPELLADLVRLKERRPDLRVILQCHGPAMEMGPDRVVKQLGKYAAGFDYVLFDASHGTGDRLDTKQLGDFLEAAYGAESLDGKGMAIAGGLNAEVVRDELPALLDEFHGVSWDAEGRLHPVDEHGKRPLDMGGRRAISTSLASCLSGFMPFMVSG